MPSEHHREHHRRAGDRASTPGRVGGFADGGRVPDRRTGPSEQVPLHLLSGSAVGPPPATGGSLNALVVELSGFPIAIGNLRVDHRDNGEGLCTGCGRPGYGAPYLPYPCVLRRLADDAAAFRDRALDDALDDLAARAAGELAPAVPPTSVAVSASLVPAPAAVARGGAR